MDTEHELNGEVKELSADEYLRLTEREFDYVDLPNGKGRVCLRSLTTEEKDEFEVRLAKKKGEKNSRGELLRMVCWDTKNDKPLFTREQALKIAKVNVKYTDAIVSKAIKLISYTEEDMEKLEKNS